MAGARGAERCRHEGEHALVRIEHLDGIARHARIVAARNDDAAVEQRRRGLSRARAIHRRRSGPRVRARVVDFSRADRVAARAQTAGHQDTAIREQR